MGSDLSKSPSPPFSATLFQPNTWAEYQSAGTIDGRIPLDRIRLWPNQVDIKEKKYWTKLAPAIHAPDYRNHIPGSDEIPAHTRGQDSKYSPRSECPELCLKPGHIVDTAIPESIAGGRRDQDSLSLLRCPVSWETLNDEMSRIDVVSLQRPSWDEAAVALPSGLILIPESTLTGIGNEAQLAAILSCAITSVLQNDSYIIQNAQTEPVSPPYPENQLYQLFIVMLSMNEQALRIGIRQMYLAGYDIREAPFAWAAAEGKPGRQPGDGSKRPKH